MIETVEKATSAESLKLVAEKYPSKVVFSTSLGQEDQVITDAILKNNIDIKIFTLDTGRLFKKPMNCLIKQELNIVHLLMYSFQIQKMFSNWCEIKEQIAFMNLLRTEKNVVLSEK